MTTTKTTTTKKPTATKAVTEPTVQEVEDEIVDAIPVSVRKVAYVVTGAIGVAAGALAAATLFPNDVREILGSISAAASAVVAILARAHTK